MHEKSTGTTRRDDLLGRSGNKLYMVCRGGSCDNVWILAHGSEGFKLQIDVCSSFARDNVSALYGEPYVGFRVARSIV